MYLAAGEWQWPKSLAARQVEKSLGRASPAVSAIAAPPNSPAESPNSRWGRMGEPGSCKAGRGPASAEVIAVQQQVFVGIDVSKLQLEVALSTGEGFAVGNDQAGVAELVRRLRTAAPELVVLEASDYERAAWIALTSRFAIANPSAALARSPARWVCLRSSR